MWPEKCLQDLVTSGRSNVNRKMGTGTSPGWLLRPPGPVLHSRLSISATMLPPDLRSALWSPSISHSLGTKLNYRLPPKLPSVPGSQIRMAPLSTQDGSLGVTWLPVPSLLRPRPSQVLCTLGPISHSNLPTSFQSCSHSLGGDFQPGPVPSHCSPSLLPCQPHLQPGPCFQYSAFIQSLLEISLAPHQPSQHPPAASSTSLTLTHMAVQPRCLLRVPWMVLPTSELCTCCSLQ